MGQNSYRPTDSHHLPRFSIVVKSCLNHCRFPLMSSPALPCMNCGFPTVDLANNLAPPPPTLLLSNDALFDSEKFEAQWSQFRLDNDAADLQRQREGLNHYEESLEVVTSPFQRLPPEILSEIFLCCVSSTPWVFDVWQPPWLLGMICGHWRAVAISTPRLWSSLQIDLDHISIDSMPIAMFLVQTYLQRSGQSPLSLVIIGLPQVNCHPVLDVLVSHSTRWQDIMLCSTRLQILDGASGRLPLLQKLKIETLDYYPSPLSMFKVAPQLRDVAVVSCSWVDGLTSLDLPWSQLTRYSGEFSGCKDALVLLQKNPNILQYRLNLKERIPSSGPGQPLRHSQLRHLILTGSLGAPCGEFLDCLTLPALDGIRLGGTIDADLVDSLISLLSRSSCSLTGLVICVVPMPAVDYTRLLQEIPLLVELQVGYGGDLSTLVTVLTERSHGRGKIWRFVPHLQSIIFMGALECNHSLLIDMIESRFRGDYGAEDSQMDPVCRLQSVRLNDRRLDFNAQIRLQQLRIQGLKTSHWLSWSDTT